MIHLLSLKAKHSIRIALASTIAVLVGYYFTIPKAYWIVICIFMIIQPTVGATLLRSKQRGINTLLGVLVGGLIVVTVHGNFWLLTAVGMVGLFFSLYYVQEHYDKAMFFFSILLMVIFGVIADYIWQYAFYRFYDTLLGVVIGFVVSLAFFPCSAREFLRQDIDELLVQYQRLFAVTFQQLHDFSQDGQMQIGRLRVQILNTMKQARAHLEDVRHEVDMMGLKHTSATAILDAMDKIRISLYALNSISNHQQPLPADVLTCLQQMADVFDYQFDTITQHAHAKNAAKKLCLPSHDHAVFTAKENRTQAKLAFLHHHLLHCETECNHMFYAMHQFFDDREVAIKRLV